MESTAARTRAASRDQLLTGSLPARAGESAANGSSKTASHSDTDKWLLVRNSLLGSSKFAKCLEEISEAEWLESRITSLKTVLGACSNYHGSSKGEMWSTLITTVSQYMGPQHSFLALISEHQDNLWTTCSLVTVSDLSSTDDAIKPADWEASGNRMSLSIPTSAVPPAYGSIELIEPTGDGMIYDIINILKIKLTHHISTSMHAYYGIHIIQKLQDVYMKLSNRQL